MFVFVCTGCTASFSNLLAFCFVGPFLTLRNLFKLEISIRKGKKPSCALRSLVHRVW